MFYTLVFTMSPCMIYVILERDVKDEVAMRCPEMYWVGQQNTKFSGMRFFAFVAGAIVQALCAFFLTVWCVDVNSSNAEGREQSIYGNGSAVLTCVIVIANMVIGVHTCAWSWVTALSYLGSSVLWFVYQLSYHSVEPAQYGKLENNIYRAFHESAGCLSTWLALAGTTGLCVIPIFVFKYFRETYWPEMDECAPPATRPSLPVLPPPRLPPTSAPKHAHKARAQSPRLTRRSLPVPAGTSARACTARGRPSSTKSRPRDTSAAPRPRGGGGGGGGFLIKGGGYIYIYIYILCI
jgi:hypothetical protein